VSLGSRGGVTQNPEEGSENSPKRVGGGRAGVGFKLESVAWGRLVLGLGERAGHVRASARTSLKFQLVVVGFIVVAVVLVALAVAVAVAVAVALHNIWQSSSS